MNKLPLLKFSLVLTTAFLLAACTTLNKRTKSADSKPVGFDSHVHLMSLSMIKDWKALGIPFSRSEPNYANIDTILAKNGANKINLIGMGYVYENPDFYQGKDGQARLIEENNYLHAAAAKYPDRVTPFFAFDPLQPYALAELKRCYQLNPKSGVKLHFNASQVYLTEPEHLKQVKALFEQAATYNMPILLHFDNGHPKFGQPDLALLANEILKDLPPIRLQIAHFGTSGGFSDKTKSFVESFADLKKKGKIPTRHTVLLDISAVALDKDSEGVSQLSAQGFTDLRQSIDLLGIENVVFGTDYPLYTSEAYLDILRNKVGLTETELQIILTNQ